MKIVRLGIEDVDALQEAAHLFDHEVTAEQAGRFLATPTHHLLLAYEDDSPAGFVSGIEMAHPDKGIEMFLYELNVSPDFRGRGLGRALVEAMVETARERGCYGMWVLADHDNEAALAAYRGSGTGNEHPGQVMLTWDFSS